ncbi:MAG: polyhydroxyalkanoic acid system family protein [Rubrivivax sp.]
MPDIHIHREHQLGLPRARKLALAWAEQVEEKFDMACTIVEGDDCDTVEFTRTGVKGQLMVAPDHFELNAKLGFLLGAFSRSIEVEIIKNLDALLSGSPPPAKRSSKASTAVDDNAAPAPKAKAKSKPTDSKAGTKTAARKG